jgi:alkylated DNA repair dioxygenase AlkB
VFDSVGTRPELAWQPMLDAPDRDAEPYALDAVAVDRGFAGRVRHALDPRSWVDVCPGWLRGADALFAALLAEAAWTAREVPMYDKVLPEPRLTALFPGRLPPVLGAICDALRDGYATPFDSVAVNLYRNGTDSVAWHGDRVGGRMRDPLVATVTLGAPRRFLLRPRGGGPAHVLRPGPGDLVVMGGACQREWMHCVPKTARPVGPRMAVTVRHAGGRARVGGPQAREVSGPAS